MTIGSIKYYCSIALTACLAPLGASCVFDKEEPTAAEKGEPVEVHFSIDIPALSTSEKSRGWEQDDSAYPWYGDYLTGDATPWDSNITNFQVMVYGSEGLIGRLADVVRSSSTSYTAHIKLENSDEIATVDDLPEAIRLHFIANVADLGTSTSQDQLIDNNKCHWLSGSGDGWTCPALMPFWGVKNGTVTRSDTGKHTIDLGTVSMLRSMAKVEIIITNTGDDDDNYSIEHAYLYGNAAKDIYVLPRYKDDGKYVATTATDANTLRRNYGDFDTSAEKASADGCCFIPAEANAKSLVFYLPEQTNSAADHLSIMLQLNSDNGLVKFDECPLEFMEYSAGEPQAGTNYNIIRNHHYRYNVHVVNGKISVAVDEWEATYENQFTFTE